MAESKESRIVLSEENEYDHGNEELKFRNANALGKTAIEQSQAEDEDSPRLSSADAYPTEEYVAQSYIEY